MPAALAFFGVLAFSLLAGGAKTMAATGEEKASRPSDVPQVPGYLVVMKETLGTLLEGWRRLDPSEMDIDPILKSSSSLALAARGLPKGQILVTRPLAGPDLLLIAGGNAEIWRKA